MNKLSIIIVNYKTPELTYRCIESILVNTTLNPEIIVVDNNSGDDSEAEITGAFQNVIWINNPSNDGFGRANNIGIQRATGTYVLLLNSDMVIPKGTIESCLSEMEKHNDVGALGCKLINSDGTHQKSTYHYLADYQGLLNLNLVYDYLFRKSKMPTGRLKAIMGAFMLIPKVVLNKTGCFDPDFFMYAEEMELCHRIHKHGFRIVYHDKVHAMHLHGASSSDPARAHKQNYLSNALLFYKVRGFFGYLLYHFLFLNNTVVNFFAMWLLNAAYRKTSYWDTQNYYFSNFGYYLIIPFIYTRNIGRGKRILRRK